mmetsp:Transcript_28632/g.50907  ORF Transcript_28632/g.50907 Transcript_28632/m.50907 type:complete len:202 (+) Transcript_28632:364-969(+)
MDLKGHVKKLDAEFAYQIARVTENLTSYSKHQQVRIKQWITKLQSVEEHPAWRKNRNKYAELLATMTEMLVLQDPFAKVPPAGPLQTLNHYGGVSAVSEKKLYFNEDQLAASPRSKPREKEESVDSLKSTIDAQNQIIKEQNFIIEGLRRELATLKQESSRKRSPVRAPVQPQREFDIDSNFFCNLEKLQGNIQAALSKYS